MGFAIPRIQYLNFETTGTTATGNNTISTVADISGIVAGMFVRGTGIPTGSTVGTVGVSSFTLAGGVLATANGSQTLDFGYEILFDYPPVEPKGEKLSTKASTSESLSGIRQVSVNYIEGTRKLSFSFLSPAIKILVDTFLQTHAVLGNSFRYFEDKTLTSYVDYELNTLTVEPKKIAPRGVDTYVWEVPLEFRRVL